MGRAAKGDQVLTVCLIHYSSEQWIERVVSDESEQHISTSVLLLCAASLDVWLTNCFALLLKRAGLPCDIIVARDLVVALEKTGLAGMVREREKERHAQAKKQLLLRSCKLDQGGK